MTKTVYVCAKSKREANEQVLNGTCMCCEYRINGQSEEYMRAMPDGTVVKIFSRYDAGGNPIAKSYGVWNAKKMRIV